MSERLPCRESDYEYQNEKVEKVVRKAKSSNEKEYAVYVLECENSDSSTERRSDPIPPEVAHVANRLFYVGCTKNLGDRLLSHIRGHGPKFTRHYAPHTLQEIQWFETREKGEQREKELAYEYRRPSIQLDPWGGNGERFEVLLFALRTVEQPQFAYFR